MEYVSRDDTVRVADPSGRISESVAFPRENRSPHDWPDPLIRLVDRRLSQITGLHPCQGEGLSVTRYQEGGFLTSHCDILDLRDLPEDSPTRRGGWRISTALLYLNNVIKGGETTFPFAGVKILPRPGRLVYFEYYNSHGEIDVSTLHSAELVLKGEKWIANKWYRERVFSEP
jgi:prolyl 4-hydroxylase